MALSAVLGFRDDLGSGEVLAYLVEHGILQEVDDSDRRGPGGRRLNHLLVWF